MLFESAKSLVHFHRPASTAAVTTTATALESQARVELAARHISIVTAGAAAATATAASTDAATLTATTAAATTSGMDEPGVAAEQTQKFHFDKVLTSETAEENVYSTAVQDYQLVESVVSGRSAAMITLGLNATRTFNYKRSVASQHLLQDLHRCLEQRTSDNELNVETRLSYACLGFSDHHCVNLLSEKTLTAESLTQGVTESFYEPLENCLEASQKLKTGFSTPGYVMVIRVEQVPVRMMVKIDSDIEKNRNVFHFVPGQDDLRPSVGYLILADMGAVRLHDGDHARNGLSSSANAFRHWVLEVVPSIGFVSSERTHCNVSTEQFPFLRLLEPYVGGNTRLLMLVDVEEQKATLDLSNGLALGEAFRKLKTKKYENAFDERVAVLWKMEQKYKEMRKAYDGQAEEITTQKCTVDQLTTFVKKQQSKNVELTEMIRERDDSLETTEADVKNLSAKLESATKNWKEEKRSLEQMMNAMKQDGASVNEEYEKLVKEKDSTIMSMQKDIQETKKLLDTMQVTSTKEKNTLTKQMETMSKDLQTAQSEAKRHEMEAISAKDLIETLKKTIDQLSQSQTHLATQLGQSANRSMDGYERTKQLWEEEKRELTSAIGRLEKDLVKKLPEATLLSKKIRELETEKKSLVERVAHAEVELESGKAQSAVALSKLPESVAVLAAESKPRSKKMDAEVEKPSASKTRTKKADIEVESFAPKARLAKTNIAIEPAMESGGEDLEEEPAPKPKGRKKTVTVEAEVSKKSEETMPLKRNTKRKSTAKPKAVPGSPMDTEEPASEVPTENESPNKKSPPAAKKRRKVTAEPPIPEPPKSDSLPTMSLAAKLKERSAAAASTTSKPSAPVIKGIINPAALQLIKAGFSLPKLKKP